MYLHSVESSWCLPTSIKVSFNARTAIKFFSRKRDQELYQPGYPNIHSAESEYQRQLDRRRKELLKKQVMTTWTLLIYVMPVPHYYSVVYDVRKLADNTNIDCIILSFMGVTGYYPALFMV